MNAGVCILVIAVCVRYCKSKKNFHPFVKLQSIFKSMQVNTFVFHAFPKAFDKNIVNATSFSVHGDFHFHLRVRFAFFIKEKLSELHTFARKSRKPKFIMLKKLIIPLFLCLCLIACDGPLIVKHENVKLDSKNDSAIFEPPKDTFGNIPLTEEEFNEIYLTNKYETYGYLIFNKMGSIGKKCFESNFIKEQAGYDFYIVELNLKDRYFNFEINDRCNCYLKGTAIFTSTDKAEAKDASGNSIYIEFLKTGGILIKDKGIGLKYCNFNKEFDGPYIMQKLVNPKSSWNQGTLLERTNKNRQIN